MTRLVLATGNPGKAAELSALLPGLELTAVPLDTPEETGGTYAENALIKARAAARATGLAALADDSGLEVRALDWGPGLHSARVAPGQDRSSWLLERMRDTDDRSARFVAALAVAWPDGRELVREGLCQGTIARAPSGDEGFGYDPVFVPLGFDRTFAELSSEVKNSISHRAAAARALLEALAGLEGMQ